MSPARTETKGLVWKVPYFHKKRGKIRARLCLGYWAFKLILISRRRPTGGWPSGSVGISAGSATSDDRGSKGRCGPAPPRISATLTSLMTILTTSSKWRKTRLPRWPSRPRGGPAMPGRHRNHGRRPPMPPSAPKHCGTLCATPGGPFEGTSGRSPRTSIRSLCL